MNRSDNTCKTCHLDSQAAPDQVQEDTAEDCHRLRMRWTCQFFGREGMLACRMWRVQRRRWKRRRHGNVKRACGL